MNGLKLCKICLTIWLTMQFDYNTNSLNCQFTQPKLSV